MAILWNDDLLTGIDLIDNQHKEMFNEVNKLLDACNNGKGRSEVANTLSFVEAYIIAHFKAEEDIMYKYIYPYHLSHIAEHQQFIDVVTVLKNELEEQGVTGQFVIKTNRKLVQWLISHIGKEDKALAKYIKEKSQK